MKTPVLVLLTTAFAAAGFAQMGNGTRMGPDVSGIMGGISTMGSMAPGPVVGADGTAYVLRQAASSSMMGSQQTAIELVAINAANGKVNWSLAISGTIVSDPVLAKDGTILLTTSEPEMFSTSTSSTAAKPALVIVAPSATSARVQARIPIDGNMLSLPVMTPDGQTIYVLATDMPVMVNRGQTTVGTTFLYGFFPGTGALKFKVQLH